MFKKIVLPVSLLAAGALGVALTVSSVQSTAFSSRDAGQRVNPCAPRVINPCAPRQVNPCAPRQVVNPCAPRTANPCQPR